MNLQILAICFTSFIICASAQNTAVPKSEILKCAVCRSLVFELHHEMEKVDKRKTIEVGSYRISSDGTQKTTTRPYAGSETHMTEVLDKVCEAFKDYAQGRDKTTGQLEVIQIVGKDGAMNPNFSNYDMVQDPDLNKGLEFHCQSITEDYEEDILKYFSTVTLDYDLNMSQDAFCKKQTKICKGLKEEL